ncbi:MAG: helix-turn-helix domain-containing protein [Thermomicrobiales bacterium]|nr:helix-turn-helix domain-containing protein [Thermomicrobiales bacterium]
MGARVIVTGVESEIGGQTGGGRLRALREARGRTQLWVEAEAELGAGYLQRVECGRVAQPSRGTVERILSALGARYGESRELLEAFGYAVASPLPTDADREWARTTSQADLDQVMFPAYALDCTARLVAWNGYLPLILGLPSGAALPGSLTRRSMLFWWFDPATPLGAGVLEPDDLHPAMLRALRYELEHYRGEAWPRELIADLETLPRFRAIWTAVNQEPPPAGPARARVPLRLQAPGAGRLEFRLASETFAHDPRFRTIYYFPTDPATIRWCAEHAPSTENATDDRNG